MGAEGDERPVLLSWKEIAKHLGVSVRTAQLWERERGLPVRRMPGEKSRVIAYPDEIDRWLRTTSLPAQQPAPPARFPGVAAGPLKVWSKSAVKAAAWFSVVLLATAGYLLLSTRKGPPANFRHEGRTLIVSDEQGRELWRRVFPEAFHPRATPEEILHFKRAWFVDLDGDGHVELLYAYSPVTQEAQGDTLFCFSDRGDEKWRFIPGRTLSTKQATFPRIYRLARLLPLSLRADGSRNLAVVSFHIPRYPTQVAVLSPQGKLLGEYYHSGHVGHIELADLDGDSKPELVLAGISNGYGAATLLVLDPESLSGASAEENPDYQLLGLPIGREKARLLLPRTCINRKYLPYGVPGFLGITGDTIRVQVSEKVDSPGDPTVHYIFDRRLNLKEVIMSDGLKILHREMEAAGQLDHALSEAEVAALRNIRYLRRLGE